MNLSTLLKAAKGGVSPEILKPMLEAMGFKLDMEPVSIPERGAAELRALALQAGRRGASLHRLVGTMKDGGRIDALIVVVPESQAAVTAITEVSKIAA